MQLLEPETTGDYLALAKSLAEEFAQTTIETERGDCAIAIATAKVAVTRIGLAIANQMFELMGARSTHSKYGFDRY